MAKGQETALPIGATRVIDSRLSMRRRPVAAIPAIFPFVLLHRRNDDDTIFLCRILGSLEVDEPTSSIQLCYSPAISLQGCSIDDLSASHLIEDGYAACDLTLHGYQRNPSRDTSPDFRLSVSPEAIPLAELPLSLNYLIPLTHNPVPALSVSLSYFAERTSTTKMTSLEKQPLLQACLKRQLFGCPLIYRRNIATTKIKFGLQDCVWTFRVVSVIVTGQAASVHELMAALILPSTRITMLHDDQQEIGKAAKQHAATNEAYTALSPAAQSLVDTISCMRHIHNWQAKSDVPRAFLFSGPPGVGKTHAVRLAVAQLSPPAGSSSTCHLVILQGSDVLATGHAADAAKALERHFYGAVQKTKTTADSKSAPVALIFLDECDALLAAQGGERKSSMSVVEAVLGCLLDRMHNDPAWKLVLVVAATNRIDSFPASLRRPGRFDREIPIAPPNAKGRMQILESLLKMQPPGGKASRTELQAIADACVGYVPADLAALVRRAELLGVMQCRHGGDQAANNTGSAKGDLLRQAMSDVGASALRDAALKSPPSTTWDDVAGDPGGAKTALRQAIEWPRTKGRAYQALGITPPRGILLHGPPGCAKTTLARAAAGASAVAFLSLSPADVYSSSYVGEAESVVRRAFTLARSAAPCVLFFDEIDAIIGSDESSSAHGMGRGSSSSAEARVLSTFLNEMDGVDGSWKDGVLVLGATNRPWTLDAALLRPGRFDKIIHVPPPDFEGRRSILKMQCQHWKTANADCSIDVNRLAADPVTGNMTGAEIVGACQEAAMRCFREAVASSSAPLMNDAFLDVALSEVKPLLSSASVRKEYESFNYRRGLSS